MQQNLQPANIKSIKLIGGNITNCCIPLEGNTIYKKGDIHNKKIYSYKTKKDEQYKNLIFRIPRANLEESDEIRQNHQDSIYNHVAQAIAEDGEIYCMDVNKIENLRGIRNIYEMKKMLKELFPDVEPEHNF